MKVAVITLTCGRLDISKQWVPTLAENAGYPYRHVIVDNGSTDGTPDYFEAQGYEVVRNPKNVGVARGWNIGYKTVQSWSPDLVVRMDDDCEVETPDTLAKIVDFAEKTKNTYVISPINPELVNFPKYMPKTISKETKLAGHRVRMVTHSGLFVAVPVKAFQAMSSAGIKNGDAKRGGWWRRNGYPTVYLEDVKAHHRGRGTFTYDKYVY